MGKVVDKRLHRLVAEIPMKMHEDLKAMSIKKNCTVRDLVIIMVDNFLKLEVHTK